MTKAKSLTEAGAYEQAAEAWKVVLEFSPTTESYLLERVRCLIEIKSYGDALSEAVRALRTNPRSMEILMIIGDVAAYQGDFDTALVYYKKALKYDPEGPVIVKKLKVRNQR